MPENEEVKEPMTRFAKETIQEISISELNTLNIKLAIPSYQRGYRWTTNEYQNDKLIKKGEIEHLLDDLWAFSNPDKKEWDTYCLQPIVLQKQGEEYWIIDGQQRLTTISIIQWALTKRFAINMSQNWTIRSYNSNKLLGDILNGYRLDQPNGAYAIEYNATINDYFRSKALDAIWQWLKTKQESEQLPNFISLFTGSSSNPSKRLVVIKYLLQETSTTNTAKEIGHAAFERLNANKIPLTSGELTKALFMAQDNDLSEHMKMEIAKEWELIERTLQNDQYWYMFKTSGIENTSTRIELIFAIVVGLDGKEFRNSKHDRTLIFRKVEEKAKTRSLDYIWKEVRNCFWWVQSCYKNITTFHLLGWLRLFTDNQPTTIYDLWQKSAGRKFNDFNNKLKKDMIKFEDVLKDVFGEEYNLDNIGSLNMKEDIYNVAFCKKCLRKFFVILNLQACINAGERFRFDLYEKINRNNNGKGWHIEHIDSQDESKSQKDRNINQTVAKNSISNLVLLDHRTNEGYKNAPYEEKRQWIISNMHNSEYYYPPCTRNAILKFYSLNLDGINQWSSSDGTSYAKQMIELMRDFLQEN